MKKVLFLCTGNSCRSIIAQVILNQMGENRFKAYSAGSFPTHYVNPDSITVLKKHNLPTNNLTSNLWDDYCEIVFDIVITVCDNAAHESCPVYLKNAIKAHWGIADPDKIVGENRKIAFEKTYLVMKKRIQAMLNLNKITQKTLNQIGKTIT